MRTETTFYNNLATLDTIKDLGGEYYEIVAVLGKRPIMRYLLSDMNFLYTTNKK